MNNKNKHKYGVSKMGYNLPAGGQNQVGYNSYSRDSYAIPKKRRKWPFVVLAVVLVLLLAAGGVAFAGVVYMNSLNDKLQNNIDDELESYAFVRSGSARRSVLLPHHGHRLF